MKRESTQPEINFPQTILTGKEVFAIREPSQQQSKPPQTILGSLFSPVKESEPDPSTQDLDLINPESDQAALKYQEPVDAVRELQLWGRAVPGSIFV